MAKPNSKWYKLDSAGTLYSALQKEEYSAIYRFSALMEKDVDPAALQRAIDRCMPRFPTFAVRIRKGAFWYYLEHNSAPGPFLKEDVSDPCQPVRFKEDNGWLVRFYYYRNRISIEVFHALSDGGGAIIFFRTLLAEYLRQTGVDIPAGNGVLDLNEPPREEELEDAYARYAGRHAFGLRRLPRAYQNTGTPEPFYTFHVTMGFVPLSRLREQAKKHNASITEYLSAVLIHVILEKQKRERPYRERPVALAEIGEFAECGLCGTAAVISPVGEIDNKVYGADETVTFPAGYTEIGPVMKKLRETLTGIQSGAVEDKHNWVYTVA